MTIVTVATTSVFVLVLGVVVVAYLSWLLVRLMKRGEHDGLIDCGHHQ